MAQKRRGVTRGLPKWGEDLPEDVGQFVVLHLSQSVQLMWTCLPIILPARDYPCIITHHADPLPIFC